MSRRNIISIGITVLAFGAAAFIIYKGFFSAPSSPANANIGILPSSTAQVGNPGASGPVTATGAAVPGAVGTNSNSSPAPSDMGTIQRILPNGSSLDFGPIKKYNSQQQLFNYPKVSPDEITVPVQQLIK